jgi:hypothetical protein
MTDIVERLRDAASNINDEWDLHGDLKEAAAEIERLRKRCEHVCRKNGDQRVEIGRLRALLRELIDIEGPQPGTAGWGAKVRTALQEKSP